MKKSSGHVVVIGAGAFGCASALQLLLKGFWVTLIDSGNSGTQASVNNGGNLNPVFMATTELIPLSLESFQLHSELPTLLSTLGVRPHTVEPVKRLLLAFTEEEAKSFEAIRDLFKCHDQFCAASVSEQQLKQDVPGLAEDVHSALLLEGNLALDPEDFLRALKDAFIQKGGRILHGVAEGISQIGNRVGHVKLNGQNIDCDATLLATGAWIENARAWFDMALPVIPVKGQMLRMKLPGYEQKFDVTYGEISLYRRRGNEIWVGMTQEQAGLDTRPTKEAYKFLLEKAARIFPKISDAELLAQTAAIRPTTSTGLPVLGKAPGWKNVYFCNGGGMKGILLCTGVARIISDLIFSDGNGYVSRGV